MKAKWVWFLQSKVVRASAANDCHGKVSTPGQLRAANRSNATATVPTRRRAGERPGQACTGTCRPVFAGAEEDRSALLSLSCQSSKGKLNRDAALHFCNIPYFTSHILRGKTWRNLSLRETSVYLWYSHIKGLYFFLKVGIQQIWLYLNKQTLKREERSLWLDKHSSLALW